MRRHESLFSVHVESYYLPVSEHVPFFRVILHYKRQSLFFVYYLFVVSLGWEDTKPFPKFSIDELIPVDNSIDRPPIIP